MSHEGVQDDGDIEQGLENLTCDVEVGPTLRSDSTREIYMQVCHVLTCHVR